MASIPPAPHVRWSVRGALRAGLVLLLGVIAGSRLVSAWVAWQAYASLTFAEADLAIAALSIAGAWLAWWLLRPRGGPPAGLLS